MWHWHFAYTDENSYQKFCYTARYYSFYCIFDQINAAFVDIRDFFQGIGLEGFFKAQMCLLVELDKQDIRMSERMTNRPVSNQIVKAVLSRLQSVFIKYQTWEVHSNLLIKPLLDFGPFYFWEAENRQILGWNTIIWKSGIWGCKKNWNIEKI